MVAAHVAPKMLYTVMVDLDDLEPNVVTRIGQTKTESSVFPMDIALPELTTVKRLGDEPLYQSGIESAPTLLTTQNELT